MPARAQHRLCTDEETEAGGCSALLPRCLDCSPGLAFSARPLPGLPGKASWAQEAKQQFSGANGGQTHLELLSTVQTWSVAPEAVPG